uniref:Uncharacterized protein n=1 Tax=Myoviridae sp. ctjz83 TaxID=2826083 RepID=A0A8D9PDW1_9CAUD|nr:MAG TPA: hypothetical protein [Myoviridae sp. ctjz83]DAF00883.1 MAG TPA: hypothetical protein [Caudoviricetes sp.]
MEKSKSVHINFLIGKSPVYALQREVELLFMGISTHLKAQKNLWKNSVN